jgi:hypothetical protein
MLSQDLRSLQTWFDAAQLSGNTMSKPAAEAFSAALGVAVESAVELERCGIRSMIANIEVDGLSPEVERLIDAARAMAGAAHVVMLHASGPSRTAAKGGAA